MALHCLWKRKAKNMHCIKDREPEKLIVRTSLEVGNSLFFEPYYGDIEPNVKVIFEGQELGYLDEDNLQELISSLTKIRDEIATNA